MQHFIDILQEYIINQIHQVRYEKHIFYTKKNFNFILAGKNLNKIYKIKLIIYKI